jgi:hypothetical protein
MEKVHPTVAGQITRYEQRRRTALASTSEWVRKNAPGPLTDSDRRRHRVLSQLLWGLERRGAKVSEEKDDLRVSIAGEDIDFRFREKSRQERVFSKDRRSSRVNLVGTGKLVVSFRTYLRGSFNEEWRETDSNPLDSQLPKIIDRFFEGAQILKAWRLEREQEEERARQAAAERAEKSRLAKIEEKRREKIIDSSIDWRVASQLRQFLMAIEAKPFDPSQEINGKTIAEWLAWAHELADALDPIHNDNIAEFFRSIDNRP